MQPASSVQSSSYGPRWWRVNQPQDKQVSAEPQQWLVSLPVKGKATELSEYERGDGLVVNWFWMVTSSRTDTSTRPGKDKMLGKTVVIV